MFLLAITIPIEKRLESGIYFDSGNKLISIMEKILCKKKVKRKWRRNREKETKILLGFEKESKTFNAIRNMVKYLGFSNFEGLFSNFNIFILNLILN